MHKFATKILVLAVICGALAFAAHSVMANDEMDGATGMSVSCLNLCITQGETGTAANALAPLALLAVFLVAFLTIDFRAGTDDPDAIFVGRSFRQEKHRYLMKSMVMLR